MQENELLSPLQLDEIKDFIDKNSYLIYKYINLHILQDIGKMNYNFFLKVVQDIFNDNIKLNQYITNLNIIPYFLFTQVLDKGKIEYTSLRIETIDFTKIDKEARVYYNYAQFSLEDDFLYIKLMQTKIGGMSIDKDIIKFTKKIPIKSSGLEDFIKVSSL